MFTEELKNIKTKSDYKVEVGKYVDIWIQEEFDDRALDCVQAIKEEIKKKIYEEEYEIRNDKKVVSGTYKKDDETSYENTWFAGWFFKKRPGEIWLDRYEKIKNAGLLSNKNVANEIAFDGFSYSLKHILNEEIRIRFLDGQIQVVKSGFLNLKKRAFVNFANKIRCQNFFNKIADEASKDNIRINKCYFKVRLYPKDAIVDLDNNEIPYDKDRIEYIYSDKKSIEYSLCIDYSISF